MDAVYKLSRAPACFNFIECLVASKTRGATSMLLDIGSGHINKYSDKDTHSRMASIVEPACALAGLQYRYGVSTGDELETGYHPSAPINAYRECGYIAKLKTVKPAAEVRYTVTLRSYPAGHHRNSNRPAWMEFARQIGAVVIEDWYEKPIHLHDRMALYAGAEMNFFTNGGAASLCVYSDYPYMLFMNSPALDYLEQHGIPYGKHFPWSTRYQHLIWADDTFANIVSCFREAA